MEILYHGIKTRYAYDFALWFPHELIMSLINVVTKCIDHCTAVIGNIIDTH